MNKFPSNHGWINARFGDCTRIANGQVSPLHDEYIDLPHVGPENIESESGRIHGVLTARELGLQSGKYYFDEDALVYSKIRPNLNKVCRPRFCGICSADAYPVWAEESVDIEYLQHFMLSPAFLAQTIVVSLRTGMPKINRADLNKIKIPLPPLPEQQKIAEILGACDEAIEAQERVIAKKQQLKKGLMQKLLTGEVRFPEFERTPWRSVKASELFTTRSEKNTNGEPVLSVTQDAGILLRSSVERRISGASKNFPNYKMVYPGDFVISLRSFQGGLEYSQTKGAVSPAYHVIHKKRELCEEFYRHFFKSWEFIGRLKTATIGIRDGKQIAFRDFSFMRLPAPAIAEQQAISGLLCEYDKEITLQQNKLEQLKQQKRSLMQQLLTGKVRVKI